MSLSSNTFQQGAAISKILRDLKGLEITFSATGPTSLCMKPRKKIMNIMAEYGSSVHEPETRFLLTLRASNEEELGLSLADSTTYQIVTKHV